MFGKKEVQDVQLTIRHLEAEVRRLQAKLDAMVLEREFWVEQSRSLQNHLQNQQRMYSSLLNQLGRSGGVTDAELAENLSMLKDDLLEPITGVEAVRALTAGLSGGCQGEYTAVATNKGKRLEKKQ